MPFPPACQGTCDFRATLRGQRIVLFKWSNGSGCRPASVPSDSPSSSSRSGQLWLCSPSSHVMRSTCYAIAQGPLGCPLSCSLPDLRYISDIWGILCLTLKRRSAFKGRPLGLPMGRMSSGSFGAPTGCPPSPGQESPASDTNIIRVRWGSPRPSTSQS